MTAPDPTQADASALDFDALEKLARAATPGPWRRCGGYCPKYTSLHSEHGYIIFGMADASCDREGPEDELILAPHADQQQANAAYIAAASPDVMQALLAERREMQAEIERGREALRPFAEAARWPIGATEITPQHVVHCDVIRTGYPPLKVGSFGLKAADFVLALTTYEAARAPVAVSPTGQQDAVREALNRLPPGPWKVWSSCSFRRITGPDGKDGGVLSGITQRSDGHPDLSMSEDQLNDLCAVINGLRTTSLTAKEPAA